MTRPATAEAINQVTSQVISAAIKIHRALGPGLLEAAYRACLCHEVAKAGLQFRSEVALPLTYHGVQVTCAYRADLVIEGVVVVEVKAVDAIAPIHMRQLQTYTCLADCRVGLLLNFGAITMRDGIRRVVNRFPEDSAGRAPRSGGEEMERAR